MDFQLVSKQLEGLKEKVDNLELRMLANRIGLEGRILSLESQIAQLLVKMDNNSNQGHQQATSDIQLKGRPRLKLSKALKEENK